MIPIIILSKIKKVKKQIKFSYIQSFVFQS